RPAPLGPVRGSKGEGKEGEETNDGQPPGFHRVAPCEKGRIRRCYTTRALGAPPRVRAEWDEQLCTRSRRQTFAPLPRLSLAREQPVEPFALDPFLMK